MISVILFILESLLPCHQRWSRVSAIVVQQRQLWQYQCLLLSNLQKWKMSTTHIWEPLASIMETAHRGTDRRKGSRNHRLHRTRLHLNRCTSKGRCQLFKISCYPQHPVGMAWTDGILPPHPLCRKISYLLSHKHCLHVMDQENNLFIIFEMQKKWIRKCSVESFRRKEIVQSMEISMTFVWKNSR